MCQPMAPALPVDRSGDSGRSPFFGQLSGKLPPASTHAFGILKSKHKGVWKFNLHWRSLLLLLTDRSYRRRTPLPSTNDLRRTLHNFRLKVCPKPSLSDRGNCKEFASIPSELAGYSRQLSARYIITGCDP
jgi:hypothetical protein